MSDYSEDIGGGYTFEHESKSDNFILGGHEVWPDVVSCNFNNRYVIAKQKPDKTSSISLMTSELSAKYIMYNNYITDSNYRKEVKELANKIISDSTVYNLLLSKGVSFRNTLEDKNKIDIISDSIFRNNPYYKKYFSDTVNYWIINKKEELIFGPFTKEEYLKKKQEIGVPKNLKLDDES